MRTFDRVLKRSDKVVAVVPELPPNDPSPPSSTTSTESIKSVTAQIKDDRANQAYHFAALRMLQGEIDGLKAAGVNQDRIIIVGFSQGALLTNSYILSLARSRSAPNPPYAAIFSFSGDVFNRIPKPDEWSDNKVERTSCTLVAQVVFLSGGRNDNVLDQQRIKDTKKSIKNAFLGGGRNHVRIELMRGQGHTISHSQITRIMAVVRKLGERDKKRRQKAFDEARKKWKQEALARRREVRAEEVRQPHSLAGRGQSSRTTPTRPVLSSRTW